MNQHPDEQTAADRHEPRWRAQATPTSIGGLTTQADTAGVGGHPTVVPESWWKRQRKKGLLVSASTIVAAIVAVFGFLNWTPFGHPAPPPVTPDPNSQMTVFDAPAIQDGVKTILINDYGVGREQIHSVNCPRDQQVMAGNKFTCTVQLGGNNPVEKVVDITVRTDNGNYQVSRLRTPATPVGVTYRCAGSAPAGVDITYGPSGSDLQATSLPFTAHDELDPSAQYYALTAQLQDSGDVSCTITVTAFGQTTTSTGTAQGSHNQATPLICTDFKGRWDDCR